MTDFIPPPDPACMEPDELARWREAAALIRYEEATNDPCQDCLAPFAASMRAIGRCNGIPGSTRRPRLATAESRFRRLYFRDRCVQLGIDPAHAERVG